MVTAKLTNYRQSPRKVRVVANLVRGKRVAEALAQLTFTAKRATDPLAKLIQSAIANAKNNHGLDADNLFVKEIRVDGGIVMKRSMPRARGSAYPIRKRTSHVLVTLAEKAPKAKAIKAPKATKSKK
jgi:large subunit ribosomal protein L22